MLRGKKPKESNQTDPFLTAANAISKAFSRYSVKDVAESLFISDTWLPNISSLVKHQFLTLVMASKQPEEFASENQINSHEDFAQFLEAVYPLIPSFSSIEDFVPVADWGQVRLHASKKDLKFFYGGELSNTYDYLTLFQLLHIPFDEEYAKHAGRSPKEELRCCLEFQNEIIDSIPNDADPVKIENISPGDVEVPPKNFWEAARHFYTNFQPSETFSAEILKAYSTPVGSASKKSLSWRNFGNGVMNGTLLPFFFLEHDHQYLPTLPRRYSSILFDTWGSIFQDWNKDIDSTGQKYGTRLAIQLYRYFTRRFKGDRIFPMVSAVTKSLSPHDTLFPLAFISRNKLFMVYLTDPGKTGKSLSDHLEKLEPKFIEALELAKQEPVTLALHVDKQNVQFRSEKESASLTPEILIVIPQASTQIQPIRIPSSMPARFFFLDSFLAIIDELDNPNSFADFTDYLDKQGPHIQPMLSKLDVFASFKDSLGVLVQGASEFDFISLDPHWGSRMRYDSLASFWSLYPEGGFFDHPRAWKPRKETESRIRLEARGYFGFALHCRIGMTNIFLTAPFEDMSYDQGRLANFLMECLEDSLAKRKMIVEQHRFFQLWQELHILFFPKSLVTGNPKFAHLKHLFPTGTLWQSDYGRPTPTAYGIRILFDDNSVIEAFEATKDSSLEAEIALEVLGHLQKIIPDSKAGSIVDDLNKSRSGQPRFKFFKEKKLASFPELVSPYLPQPADFKKAKKRIAELARQLDLTEGYFKLEEAKPKVNALRDQIVSEIDSEVRKYDFTKAVPFLIARIDALNSEYEHNTITLTHSLEHEIDFEPEARHAEQHTDFINTHKNYRYLIEKFVQLEPHGRTELDIEDFRYLIALIDWLHVFYTASDCLHYGIMPVGMNLTRDYLVEIQYDKGMKEDEKAFAQETAKLNLGLIGNPKDKVDSPRPIEEFLEELDDAFKKDLGFSFRTMINVQQVLTHWAACNPGTGEAPYYSAEYPEIEKACAATIKAEIRDGELKSILDFLTLQKDSLLRVLGQDELCADLPVWEYRKRFCRYNLRPLIRIGEKYYWGPFSTRRSGMIWSGTPSSGNLPTDLQAQSIEDVVRKNKKLTEAALADKTLDIIKRYTPHARKNLDLTSLKPKGSHPSDLGDYDSLAYLETPNVILNVECKDLLPPRCYKDAKRLRETIFGVPSKNEGHFEMINRRIVYLSKHLPEIAAALNWPVKADTPPKILTLYVSRTTYWWTRFPPQQVASNFIRVDLLSEFVGQLTKHPIS
jgi:hypothetical protein